MTELRTALIGFEVSERNITILVKKYAWEFMKLIVPVSIFVIARMFSTQCEFSIESFACQPDHLKHLQLLNLV